MNHKITFQELVDAIAEQSGKSKQFTHDFVKDFAALIKEGLENDGTVNIAGLGKFELKKMDEREGYNPETEEKITIPAHNKIEFTPYKDLEELVNAPYSHMEPEIIEEETGAGQPADEEKEEESIEEDQTETDSPASDEEPGIKKAPWEEDMESEIEVDEDDPFGLNAKHKNRVPFSFDQGDAGKDEQEEEGPEDEEDVVEFSPEIAPEEPAEKEDRTAGEQEDKNEEKESEREPKTAREEKPAAAEIKASRKSSPSFRDRSHRRQNTGGAFWIIAAAFIVLLLAIAAWYLMGTQQQASPPAAASETRQVQGEEETPSQDQTQGGQPEQQDDAVQQQAQGEAEAEQEAAADAGQAASTGQKAADQSGQTADPDAAPPVETITVSAGQTLWGLAASEYENPYLWPWIYDTNKPSINDPDIIYVGQSLDIPQRRGQNNELSNNDSLQVALGYVETYLWYKENNLENARFYLYAAKKYHNRVFEYTDATFDEDDLRFANRAQ
ncbi:MAG TPA: HU family DNA-binding protein [Halalkalibaculum sp.]|nr:HU family DNA-binding protein [Halalkalibaculum sp.]